MTHLTRPWGGAGLAMMLGRTALRRASSIFFLYWKPSSRAQAHRWPGGPSAVYYAMCDRAVTHFYDTRIDRLERRATRCVL